MSELSDCTDAELRAEVRRRGYELHSKEFSESRQHDIRAIAKMRRDLDALEQRLTKEPT